MLKKYKEFINESISAWHGTPHKFDEFSTNYIGKGEGNQSYGWGLYFTDKKEIGEYYAKNVGKKFIISDDAPDYNGTNRNKEYLEIAIEYFGDPDAFIKKIRESKPYTYPSGLIEISLYIGGNLNIKISNKRILINYIKKYAKNLGNSKLYKVILHDNKNPNEYEYIKWYDTLTDKQKNLIRNQAKKENINVDKIIFEVDFFEIRKSIEGEWAVFDKDSSKQRGHSFKTKKEAEDHLVYLKHEWEQKGNGIYQDFERIFGSSKEASLFLLRAGIDGIKYPSEYLRKSSHEDSFNYVVFDSNNVKIESVE